MDKTSTVKKIKTKISKTRLEYIFRLVGRIICLLVCILMLIFKSEDMSILEGMNFFKGFSMYHIIWIIWIIDMILQLIPVKDKIPLGSQKLFKLRFKPIREKINYQALKEYVVSTTKAAYKIFLIWVALLAVLGGLYWGGIIGNSVLFIISVFFYVCDLICVLIWCPFRLIMKNKCCTTCRIFNWDHLMMFTPMIFIIGFYSISLIVMAFAVWLVWEFCVMVYPERFWEYSNAALQCSQCTDKLCTQYCKKLRK
ncbi:MAG: hypothetical protein E7481_06685 [Ruminococcaceae bacterium]|nr:hypothetical protein [Oscillospiraceae bacterium]